MARSKTEASSATAAITVDGKGVVTAVSAPALTMLDADADDVIGVPVDRLLQRAEEAGISVEQPAWLCAEPSGGTRLYILNPIKAPSLQPDDDESQLRLAAGMAHDFDNLLAIISGHLQMAESRTDAASLREHIRQSLLACAMGARMTRRLRTFARRQTLDARPHDINALVMPVADALSRILEPHRTITYDLEPGIPPVTIDRSEFENALLNLLLNAMDATQTGGTITIATRHEAGAASGHANLTVSDNGTGMPAHVARRAFEPFFSTKPPNQGTGLGLATVAGFARQSGGTVELSTRSGVGTSVTLRLPFHRSDREPT